MARPHIQLTGTQAVLSEISQAKIRIVLHALFIILTITAHQFDPSISFESVVGISLASFAAASALYFWARHLQTTNAAHPLRLAQRSACILSDNLFVTVVLGLGGGSTAGLWTIYLWTSIGYGVRYGIEYLWVNVIVSAASFALMARTTAFWSTRPPFVLGMLLGMVIVPLYTGFLIKQLHLAVREKEGAYRAKSEFLARMSHELRTPLHAIISTAELLKGKAKSAVQNDYVDIIALSSSTLLDLINRVLDLSKFESGQVGLATEQINLHELLADAVNMVFQQATAKGLELRLFSDPQISLGLCGSPAHVKEVFLNILSNAVKFTDSGCVAVSAFLESETSKVANIAFEIRDSGCGIPEHYLGRIFEPFTQADQTNTRRHGGTGLGTSFSREILRLMGGVISIESAVGLGTTVRFTIPFEKRQLPANKKSRFPIRIAVLGSSLGQAFVRARASEFGATVVLFDMPHELMFALLATKQEERIDGIFVEADKFGCNLAGIPKLVAERSLTRFVPIIGFGAPELKTVARMSGYLSYITRTSNDSVVASALATVASFANRERLRPIVEDARLPSKPLSVLVADDNATNRRIAEIALEEAGHRCTLVENGDDALFALNDVQFDVAILDMHMPGRNGIEVAKIYRFSGFASDPTPIILLTADCTSEARAEAASAGISKFLTKPILPSEIVRVVEDLGRHGGVGVGATELTIAPFFVGDKERLVDSRESPHNDGDGVLLNIQAVGELIALMTKVEQREFFSEFCDDATNYVAKFESIRVITEAPAVREAMHALVGASLIIGATRLARSARRIEKANNRQILQKKDEYLTELRLAFDDTKAELFRLYLS